MEFKEECGTRGFCLMLADPEHQKINKKVEVTWSVGHAPDFYVIQCGPS